MTLFLRFTLSGGGRDWSPMEVQRLKVKQPMPILREELANAVGAHSEGLAGMDKEEKREEHIRGAAVRGEAIPVPS